MAAIKIAIIGAGVSGLGVAYEMRRKAKSEGKSLEIHLFEARPHIGGNADTVIVSLGERKPGGGKFLRWADLCVNDINLTAYKRVAAVMKDIGYLDDENQNMCPLENTETFYDDSAGLLVTDDSELEHGASNPEFELKNLKRGQQKAVSWIKVVFKAAQDKSWQDDKPNLELTVGQFFDDVIADPEAMLKDHTQGRGIIWSDKNIRAILKQLVKLFFLPRIAAMYFANDEGPENMLLAAPMCYYSRQEGQGSDKPADRRYFVGGSITWLRKLQENLLETALLKPQITVCFRDNYRARVRPLAEQIEVRNANDPKSVAEVFDKCIVTVHADDAAELLEVDPREGDEHSVKDILNKITYTHSTAYCHSYAGLLPADRNQWRSYNVPIRNQESEHKGYSMTYVCNRHQNDSAKPAHLPSYNRAGLPQFFVTLNPQHQIPKKYILRQADSKHLPDDLDPALAEPQTNSDSGLFHSRKQPGEPAISEFKHNLLDRDCFVAQTQISEFNQSSNRLFFAGGWSKGSGLQEECWEQAELVAARVIETIK